MDALIKFFSFVSVCLALINSSTHAEDVCVKKSACSCEFSNGTGIDLMLSIKSEAKPSFSEAQYFRLRTNGSYEMSTYYYHPCLDINFDEDTKGTNSTCKGPLALCRHVERMAPQNVVINKVNTTAYIKDSDSYDYLGTSNETKFSSDGRSIIFKNAGSQTTVMLVCADASDKLEVLSLVEPNNLVLTFYSRNACMLQLESPGRSFGSILCIIFFSILILYLVLGICTKKFLMGATGVEVIPNLAFWTDLPNLVKDGWAFTVSGFKLPPRGSGPATSPDPNSYDSI